MDRLGFEPRASCLQSRRSSADLPARPRVLSVAPRMKLSAFVGLYPPAETVRPSPIRRDGKSIFLEKDVLIFRSNSDRMEGLITPAFHDYHLRGCDVEGDRGDERRRVDVLTAGHGRSRGDLPSLSRDRRDRRRAWSTDVDRCAVAGIHDLSGRHDLVYVVQAWARFRRRRR